MEKNRLLVDLRPGNQIEEEFRAQALSALRASAGQETTLTWIIMVHPDGNAFCMLSALERAE